MFVNAQEHLEGLLSHALIREVEIYQYQLNIDNYTQIVSVLPQGAWPEHLAQYAAVAIDEIPQELSDEDEQMIIDLQYRDRLKKLLRTEKAEQTKSKLLLEVLKNQIGSDYETLIAAKKNAT